MLAAISGVAARGVIPHKLVASLPCQGDRALNEAVCLTRRGPLLHEAVPARLVAGRRDDSGARVQIRTICGDDGPRIVSQQYAGPEIAVDIAAHGLALGGKTAVDQDWASGGKQGCEVRDLCVTILHMHRPLSLHILPFVLILAGCSAPPAPPSLASVPFVPDSGSIAVRCGTLIDGHGRRRR